MTLKRLSITFKCIRKVTPSNSVIPFFSEYMPQGTLQFTREWGGIRGLIYSYFIVQYQLFVKAATCNFLRMCDQGFVGAARFCAKWGIKLVQATLIPLARSYFPLNCEQADQQIFGSSVKSGLIIGHRNTSLLMSIS